MSDTPDKPVLTMLWAIRGALADIKAGIAELKERMGLIEDQSGNLGRRADRPAGDMERGKRRLDLADA
jgi:hypothetical protein